MGGNKIKSGHMVNERAGDQECPDERRRRGKRQPEEEEEAEGARSRKGVLVDLVEGDGLVQIRALDVDHGMHAHLSSFIKHLT